MDPKYEMEWAKEVIGVIVKMGFKMTPVQPA